MSILGCADVEPRVGAFAFPLSGPSAYGDGKAKKIDPGVASMIRKAASDYANHMLLGKSKSETNDPQSINMSGGKIKRWKPPTNPFPMNS